MKIKDIVNRDIVNLENCESEPIHIPGSIQPHGFLVALNDKLEVEFCSGNVKDFIGLTHEQLLGKKISTLLNDSDPERLITYIKREAGYADAPLRTVINNTHLECVSHHSGDVIILEFERESTHSTDHQAIYLETRQFIHNIENSDSLKGLCQLISNEVRKITGYDRVMVYRFDEEYNGEVFAESLNDNIEPFLGLHYPHTDIPPQARELYIRNLLRLIVDVNYEPIPLYTIDNGGAKNLDLGHAMLRSVSPIHIQYLQNMGVGATLTISLVHEHKLWGLIACHHYSAKYLDHTAKVSAKLQAHFLTSQLKVRESNEEYLISQGVDKSLQALFTEHIAINRESLNELVQEENLMKICHASGVVLLLDGKFYQAGNVPEEKELRKLIDWLEQSTGSTKLVTDKLHTLYPGGEAISDTAAGLIYHSLGPNRNSMTWFRHETQREVTWAGDPAKAILKDEKGLHPRKSFNLWKEIVKGRSNPWLKPELNAASAFIHYLQRQIHLMVVTEDEARYRALNGQLMEANAELENINWISSHDLKEPLRKIQVFASRILESQNKSTADVMDNVSRMRVAAARMQTLIEDILSYSRVRNIQEIFEDVSLNEVMVEMMIELQEEVEENHATVNIGDLPRVHGSRLMLGQVFLNLMRNALKFRTAEKSPVIDISCSKKEITSGDKLPAGSYHEIIVKDNGIGFEEEYNEKIFNVFSRLNRAESYSGSGVGLALCRKIMSNHNGSITAEGVKGEGATFRLLLPA